MSKGTRGYALLFIHFIHLALHLQLLLPKYDNELDQQ